jgi:hypothetical protein
MRFSENRARFYRTDAGLGSPRAFHVFRDHEKHPQNHKNALYFEKGL